MAAVARPQPIAPIVITIVKDAPDVLRIAATNDDAQAWIRKEAPRFGFLNETESSGGLSEYFLNVSQAYDVSQIKGWLEGGYQG